MATSNGDIHHETAECFAKDYLKDLLDKKLSAFEEETLDLTIKSKYDDLEVEDQNNNIEQVQESKLSLSPVIVTEAEINSESEQVIEPGHNSLSESDTKSDSESTANESKVVLAPEPNAAEFKSEENSESITVEHPPEPSHKQISSEFQIESISEPIVSEGKVLVEPEPDVSQFKSKDESELKMEEPHEEPEPGVCELTSNMVIESEVVTEPVCKIVEESVKEEENSELEPNHEEMSGAASSATSNQCNGTYVPELSEVCQMSMVGQSNGVQSIAGTDAEKEEKQDTVPPMTEAKPIANKTEDELFALQFNKIGLTKDWWVSKRALTEQEKDEPPTIDKFRTIKQNIKKGNTRSLKERFETFGKLK